MKAEFRPAFYSLRPGAWRDYVTLLHLPFTLWHLSYVVLGTAAAPAVRLDRLALITAAFFLAVGVGAHALDEYSGRPLGTRISNRTLLALAALSIGGALAIGGYYVVAISLWMLPFVVFGGLIVAAYNLELWGGRLHSAFWFGVSWGALPAVIGYLVSAESLGVPALLVAAACFALSLVQRTLSRQAKELRRNVSAVSGRIEFHDGRVEPMTTARMIAPPESALRMLGIAIPLLALGWLAARL